MARKVSKNTAQARALVEPRPYAIGEAIPLLQKAKFAKFDETVDLTMRLGVDTRHADQMVRGTVVLPHGLGGKSKVVAVIASGDKLREAEGGRRGVCRRRGPGRADPERELDGLRRPDRDARHDAFGRPSR